MNKLMIALLLALALALPLSAQASGGGSHVNGYVTKKGTFVAPSHRSGPNGSKNDNFSSKGKMNPFTGKPGKVDPHKPK